MSIAIALRLIMAISVVMEEGFRFSRPFVVATIRGAVTFLKSITLLGVMSKVMVESFSLCFCISFSRPLVVSIVVAIGHPVIVPIALVMIAMVMEWISLSLCIRRSFVIATIPAIR